MNSPVPRLEDRVSILGVRVRGAPLSQLVTEAMQAIEQRNQQIIFACANVHSVVQAQGDAEFHRALTRAAHLVADGVGVVLAGRAMRVNVGPRITGFQYFQAVMSALAARGGGRVFFVGTSERVLSRVTAKFNTDYATLVLCGTYAPPFGQWPSDEDDRIIAALNNARPDVVWIGMTAPKQEKWVERNHQRITAPVVGCIGAVFDFYAGTKPRAPAWMCRFGLEWIHRLATEPRRMWRRHLISIPKFVLLTVLHLARPTLRDRRRCL